MTCARLTLLTAVLATAFAASGRAQERMAPARGGLEAKLEYCKTCHGLSGQGYLGYFPMPRLAGQQPEYIEAQLRAFIERRRSNPIMRNVAHVLSPSMITALANHFHNLNPPPFGGGPRGQIAGKRIYEEGLPEANVPACSACHGTEGKGQNEIPRLAGQLYPYVIKELVNWGKERGQNPAKPDTSAIMSPVAHSLSKTQIDAVAAFVSYLK